MIITALITAVSTLASGIVLTWAYQSRLRTDPRKDIDKTIAETVRER
jgi:hypothetical protein